MPFGGRHLKLSSGEVMDAPNIIRCMGPATIIQQYQAYCEENEIRFSLLGSSTMFKILSECSATVRKSLEGLDYFVAEGSRGFQDLQDIVLSEGYPEASNGTELNRLLLEAKHYMKTDYKVSSQILEQVETNSQSQTSETDITLSQVSGASVVKFLRLESLNNFLSICNVSPVKKLTNLLSESSEITFIPGLTAWRYYEAKKHTANVGVGLPVKELTEKRVKINIDSLKHFIDFVTSSHMIKDLPYGQKTLKLETGEVVTIPNVIRSLKSTY
ncbi:Hypothetical predicted protein [Mytilus galloprovincialis]|uniref:Uncharacterized protein n=1 Tax=Mytilus galloprovincialis TaxID=29158 RepID=A0A8B6ET16_MYTGA|nr:Hypothetical predicted protein [Mytilus galloprovincialis]